MKKKTDTIHMIVSMTSTMVDKRNVQRQFVAPVTNGKWENATKINVLMLRSESSIVGMCGKLN